MNYNLENFRKMADDKNYEGLISEMKCLYERCFSEEITALRYSDYIVFRENGSRREYERPYFKRRGCLLSSAILCMIYDDKKYLTSLCDTIWAIFDEYTWAVPAHMWAAKGPDKPFIDLFAAETGFALSEIYTILKDKLPDIIKERIILEIDRRIINPFIENFFHWETKETNWSAVCGGAVGSTFILMRPEKFPIIEARIEKALDCFLKSYEEDGVCREGYGYWNYGFGYFVYYAELLHEFSNGEKTYFDSDKIKKIAEFQQKVFIQGNVTASFSDSTVKASFNIGLCHFLKAKYDIALIDEGFRTNYENNTGDPAYRFAASLRNFVWFNPEYTGSSEDFNYYYLEKSNWYINKKENYAFAAKGGDNDEPHNQNDVGCFIISVNNEQLISDVGMGEYTLQYFREETRYKLICNSSRGHSVPIVNGNEQSAGKEFYGKILSADHENLEIEFAKAYDEPELKALNRKFLFNDNEIILKDEFIFEKNTSYIERFITKCEPKISDSSVIIKNLEIKFDKSRFTPSVNEEHFSSHDAKGDILYTIDFECISKTDSKAAEFKFLIN